MKDRRAVPGSGSRSAVGLADLAQLVRAPAALSVPGDVLAGAAAAGRPLGVRTVGVMASSVCLYWAGMALNDYADATVDAVERPERPVPSGRVPRRTALAVAGALTAGGLALAAASGADAVSLGALPLAGAVWAYDLKLKSTPAGPAAMASRACPGRPRGRPGRRARAGPHGRNRCRPAAWCRPRRAGRRPHLHADRAQPARDLGCPRPAAGRDPRRFHDHRPRRGAPGRPHGRAWRRALPDATRPPPRVRPTATERCAADATARPRRRPSSPPGPSPTSAATERPRPVPYGSRRGRTCGGPSGPESSADAPAGGADRAERSHGRGGGPGRRPPPRAAARPAHIPHLNQHRPPQEESRNDPAPHTPQIRLRHQRLHQPPARATSSRSSPTSATTASRSPSTTAHLDPYADDLPRRWPPSPGTSPGTDST